MEATQLGCICMRLGWRPGEVSENFCSHPNPLRLLWWRDLRELFITFPFSCPRKVVALPWLHEMTKSLLEVCRHLSELKPKAPGLYLLGEHPLSCWWNAAAVGCIAAPKLNQELHRPALAPCALCGRSPSSLGPFQGKPGWDSMKSGSWHCCCSHSAVPG